MGTVVSKYTKYHDFYADEPLVGQNVFRNRPADRSLPRNLPESRHLLPDPFWAGHESAVACYWKVWDLAFRNLKQVSYGNGFITPYIDTAFNDCLFMWDSAFILMFARYGERAFPFQKTLDNFYAKQHLDGFISRELQEWDGQDRFHRFDPASTGPDILGWNEWEYFLNFGDRERLAAVFVPLLAYHRWLMKQRAWPDGTYWSCGLGCGMDNCPRVPAGCNDHMDHGHMSWIDASAQAVLSARVLVAMAETLDRRAEVTDLEAEITRLTRRINETMWDTAAAFYADRRRDGSLSPVKHVGAFWTLLAGVVPPARLGAFTAHLTDPRTFKRPHCTPSLAADAPEYHPEGQYWRGGVWPSTNYMVLRGLTHCGLDDLAYELAANHHANVVTVFEETGTVFENYAPEKAAKGNIARRDFVGWGGVPPVAVFLEYILGVRADVPSRRIVWDVRQLEEHGVRRYPFGPAGTLDLHASARRSLQDEPQVTVTGSLPEPAVVEVRWSGGRREIPV